MGFQEYLISLGYKPKRCLVKNNGVEFVDSSYFGLSDTSISTILPGGLEIVYIKENSKIFWGIEERGLPPTLLYPRLIIKNNIGQFTRQQQQQQALIKYSNEQIYNAIINNTEIEL